VGWLPRPTARTVARQLEHCSDDTHLSHMIRLIGLGAISDRPAAQAARDKPRIARGILFLRWPDVLHGAVVLRTRGRRDDSGRTESAGVARTDDQAFGRPNHPLVTGGKNATSHSSRTTNPPVTIS
jgi:hypothetical protein